MKLTDLSSKVTEWFNGTGLMADIVISSRIRLARNIAGFNFLTKCSNADKLAILNRFKTVLLNLDILHDAAFFDVDNAAEIERVFMVERHLISRHMAAATGPRGVVVADNELFTAMINEEDHLRLQTLKPGLALTACWQRINEIDDAIQQKVRYAFDRRLGYLTACPTNLGTGIRVSVMLHLPALKMTEQLDKFIAACREMNLAVRGLFGEGTEALGDFFQISNQQTLGVREEDIVEKFTNEIIPAIVNYEKRAREELFGSQNELLEDKLARALALLKHARLISSNEALFLLSNLRMGVNMKRITNIPISTINELFLLTQPGHLQINQGRCLEARQRDLLRAATIRTRLN